MSLKQKTIKGLIWSGISQGGKQISQFIITAILARLLSPNDFGLLAMATVFINFMMIFGEMGISSALIQKQDTHDRHYYSAFWLNIAAGIILTLIFIAIAPLIAAFYKKPELTLILRIISINFFISSFVIIQQAILTKEMDFKKLATRDLTAIIISGIIGILLAYQGFGVWSLVYQSIIFTLTNAILLWSLSPWRPKFKFAKQDIKDIFSYSANLTGFNIANYFARNLDQLLIGKFLGSTLLGYYSLAYKIMLYPLGGISLTIGRVLFPAISKIQNDLNKVRSAYMKMLKAISLITFPLMTILFFTADEFITIFFGPKWGPAIFPIKILCFCGMMQSISTTVGIIYQSQGRPDVQLKFNLFVSLPSVVIVVLSGLRWGINGIAIAYTIRTLIITYFSQFIANRLIKLSWKSFFSSQYINFIISIFIFIALFFTSLLCVQFLDNIKIVFIIKLIISLLVFVVSAYSTGLFKIKDKKLQFNI